MSYTTPPTFVAGDPLAAADLNILGDDIEYLKGITDGLGFSGARVTRAASTSISNNADTAITFTAEPIDIGSWFSSGTDVVVPVSAIPAGYTNIVIQCVGSTTWTANGTGRRYLYVKQNGTIIAGASFTGDSGEDMFEMTPPAFVSAAAGDVLTLNVKQTSGGALACYNSQLIVVRFAPLS